MPEFDAYLELRDKVYLKYRRRDGEMAFIKINGHLIVLDSQFKDAKSMAFAEFGLFNQFKPSLYIKYENNKQLSQKVGCPVTPWVMFPAGWDLVQKFEWGKITPIRTAVLASGKHSLKIMKRVKWFDKARELDSFDTKVAIPTDKYCRYLKKSKWGVILSRGNDKNTREYEFISNFLPLALNYHPEYNFPFHPNQHFYYMRTPDDLEKLTKVDPQPYHKRSKELWNTYFRPDMASKMLLRMAGIKV
jgi:hypothetical protein